MSFSVFGSAAWDGAILAVLLLPALWAICISVLRAGLERDTCAIMPDERTEWRVLTAMIAPVALGLMGCAMAWLWPNAHTVLPLMDEVTGDWPVVLAPPAAADVAVRPRLHLSFQPYLARSICAVRHSCRAIAPGTASSAPAGAVRDACTR